MKPRVAIVVPGLTLGGGVPSVARFLLNTAVNSQRYVPTLVSLSMSSVDPCSVRLRAPGSWIRGVATADGAWSASPYTHVGAIAGELEFQRYRPRAALSRLVAGCSLIQVVSGSAAWANTVIGLHKPVSLQVATRVKVERRLRDKSLRGIPGLWRKTMTRITDRLDDRALRRVDAIQLENPWMLAYARDVNVGRAVDVRYAPPGIDARYFRPQNKIQRMADPYILCVGRLDDPRKNIAMLLSAYAHLPSTLRPRVKLLLAGSSSPTAAFWRCAETLGVRTQVRYIAKPDDAGLLDLYQHASAFALPSDEEGLGVVLLEAMACGVPPVATRCGGPDGIITDGLDGFLVPRDDVAAMSSRLASLLTDPGRNAAMGAAARSTIEQRYDERVAGEAFLEVWDSLLRKRATARCAD